MCNSNKQKVNEHKQDNMIMRVQEQICKTGWTNMRISMIQCQAESVICICSSFKVILSHHHIVQMYKSFQKTL